MGAGDVLFVVLDFHGGHFVELHEKTTEQLGRVLTGEIALLYHVFVIERVEMLIETARHLRDRSGLQVQTQVDEPEALHRLVEVACRLRRHPVAHLGDPLQLPLAAWVLFLCRHLRRQAGVAAARTRWLLRTR